MKAIYKSNSFSLLWYIYNNTTRLPFDFTGKDIEVWLISSNYKEVLQNYTVRGNVIESEIETNILPFGVYTLMCRYKNLEEQAYISYPSAFHIIHRPEFAPEDKQVVTLESYSTLVLPSSVLEQFNSLFVKFLGTPYATRNNLPMEIRRPGLIITYINEDGEVITERSASDSQKENMHWGLDVNWSRIDELSLSGDIFVSANGTWILNGTDTGIPARGPKGDTGLTPWLKTIDNKLHFSYDNVTWEPCSDYIAHYFRIKDNKIQISADNSTWTTISDYIAHYFRVNGNKLQISADKTNWETVSDYIASWFRWQATSGDTQSNNVGRLQISRDNKTWTNLSNDIVNNLHISKYIGADEALPTTGIAEGTIYAKGPTYAEDDTLNENPIYRLWVYAWKNDILDWVDNGSFTSIAAGVVQESGDSETEVMSQKAVTEKLSKLGSEVGIKETITPNAYTAYLYKFVKGKSYVITPNKIQAVLHLRNTPDGDNLQSFSATDGYNPKTFTAEVDANYLYVAYIAVSGSLTIENKDSIDGRLSIVEEDITDLNKSVESLQQEFDNIGNNLTPDVIDIKVMASSGIVSQLAIGEYGYNTAQPQKVIYKKSDTEYDQLTPTPNAIYRYNGVYYRYNGTTLDVEIDTNEISQNSLNQIVFEQGSLLTTTGGKTDNSSRIRTKNYIQGRVRVKVPKGYNIFNVFYYKDTTFDFDSYIQVNQREYVIGKDNCVSKFVIVKEDNTQNIIVADIKSNLVFEDIENRLSALEDNSNSGNAGLSVVELSVMASSGVINALQNGQYGYNTAVPQKLYYKNDDGSVVSYDPTPNAIYRHNGTYYHYNGTNLDIDYSKNEADRVSLNSLFFAQGSIQTANGIDSDNDNRIRTIGYINGKLNVKLPEGYNIFTVYYYDKDTLAFDSYIRCETNSYTIYKEGCVARFTVTKIDTTQPIKVSDIKTNTAVDDMLSKGSSGGGSTLSEYSNKGIIDLKAMTSSGIVAKLSVGEYGYNYAPPGTLIYKNTETTYVKLTPNVNSIFRYKGSYWRYTGSNNLSLDFIAYKEPYVKFDIDHELKDVSAELALMDYSNGSAQSNVLEQVYERFDELVSAHPDYVTKVDAAELVKLEYPSYANLGNQEGTEDITITFDDDTTYTYRYAATPSYKTYMYKFIDGEQAFGNIDMTTTILATRPKRKLLIISGLHGNEIAAPFNTWMWAKQLCECNDINFDRLRSAFDVYIIPCLNGYGMYHPSRCNANYVNINRNFPVKTWAIGGNDRDTRLQPSGCDYTGDTSGSEFETKIVMAITNELQPDMTVDHHNYSKLKRQFFSTLGNHTYRNLAYQSAVDCSYAFRKELPTYFGTKHKIFMENYLGSDSPVTSAEKKSDGYASTWWEEQRIQLCCTIECCQCINYMNGVYSTELIDNFGAKAFSVAEYTLRSQIFRYAEWCLKQFE